MLALDHSAAFLRRARHHATRRRRLDRTVRAVAQDLPLLDGHADAVVMGGTLNEIGDAGAALREVRRVLACRRRAVSVSLVRATGRSGRTVQGALGATGIEFPTEADTIAGYQVSGLDVLDARRDGIVLRTRCAPG